MQPNPKTSEKKIENVFINFEYALERGVDLNNRVIQLTEDIEDIHFSDFDTAMNTLESLSRKTITIKINSYGGDAYTALAIVGRMQESTCRLHTKGYGKIMSASTIILAAGHKRSLSRLAEFMHHESSYGIEGKHSEIAHTIKQFQKQEENWCVLMQELTGVEKEYWLSNGTGKDLYLDPQACLQLNIVDEVF
jgi:ATP-dependent Clp protease, protease subunit